MYAQVVGNTLKQLREFAQKRGENLAIFDEATPNSRKTLNKSELKSKADVDQPV